MSLERHPVVSDLSVEVGIVTPPLQQQDIAFKGKGEMDAFRFVLTGELNVTLRMVVHWNFRSFPCLRIRQAVSCCIYSKLADRTYWTQCGVYAPGTTPANQQPAADWAQFCLDRIALGMMNYADL